MLKKIIQHEEFPYYIVTGLALICIGCLIGGLVWYTKDKDACVRGRGLYEYPVCYEITGRILR